MICPFYNGFCCFIICLMINKLMCGTSSIKLSPNYIISLVDKHKNYDFILFISLFPFLIIVLNMQNVNPTKRQTVYRLYTIQSWCILTLFLLNFCVIFVKVKNVMRNDCLYFIFVFQLQYSTDSCLLMLTIKWNFLLFL